MNPEIQHLKAAGVADPIGWLDPIQQACARFQIDTPQRIAAFLAQTAHESAGYTTLEENLNYRATTLATCWPKRFAVLGSDGKARKNADGVNQPNALALSLEHRPEQIANTVYADRMGNGGAETGDGWKYRGRGLVQITGKDNYVRCGMGLDLDLIESPDLLLNPDDAALSASWFWDANGCNRLIDSGDFNGLTKCINGGTIGIEDRTRRYKAVLAAMD